MDEYEIFRGGEDYFNPKTPVAALKAYESGFIPISAFINKSNSTKPLDEEPYDIEAIERLLSRENLKLRSNIMLMGIFEKLIFHRDQEIALFAAESINIIENRYNKKIQEIKEKSDEEKTPDDQSLLGTLFYELAILNVKRAAIKDFYLKESLSRFSLLKKERGLDDRELNIYIRLLLELRLVGDAARYLESDERENIKLILFLRAETEFARKNFQKVKEICTELTLHIEELTEREFVMVSYWLGA
ncbi:MAG: hypothetical protein JXR86_20480 [Spirochaetales bacterium]|nr:hypothetical protein [Spirochaetales bacterium]